MVSFICDACGNTVKKNQVEKHYQTACRNCSVLSCIDCGVDFPGDAYASHTSCITEAEKYQGHLYQPKDKENKGESKQRQWIQVSHFSQLHLLLFCFCFCFLININNSLDCSSLVFLFIFI